MRHTTATLLTVLLLGGGAVGCGSNADDTAKDCAAALTERTGGDHADTPTIPEAKERVDAFDKTLAGMVRSGYSAASKEAFDTVAEKTKEGGETRPKACEPLSEDDYTVLHMAKSIDGLGWTGEGGEFDKLKMADSLGN